ncbi:hypothetical protein PIB30_074268 [Stylosanthes scabra]|uniref:Uncharacterized protein n=1 Tax=Stylosanthes scabra TaxID=79078 RepID=A0ABU6UND6_9FABA|nr:hypothetical protein [Stylosanthes scabra]
MGHVKICNNYEVSRARLTMADEAERRSNKLLGEMKVLSLQKAVVVEERAEAVQAKLKAEEDLKSVEAKLEALGKEKDDEIERLVHREEELVSEKQCEDLAEDVKAAVSATELAILAPDFNIDQIGFFKDIVDGKVIDPSD